MNRYKKLVANTLLFGIATFSTKLLSFVMMPIITGLLTTDDYSTSDLIFGTCNFIVPFISVCIHEAVIRFGLDKSEKKSDVYTTAMLTIFAGYILLLACYPVLGLVTRISEYRFIIYIYVLTSALRTTTTHFVRASGFTRIFALDGLFTSACTIGLVIYFVKFKQFGIIGYVSATIIADAASAVALTLFLRLYRFFKPRSFNRETLKAMLGYSAPLVPTAIMWWVTNLSDRFLVDWIAGPEFNGLYATAYKIPTAITLVSTIFIQAWQISAFTEEKERDRFYSTIFSGYSTLIFLAASGLILLIKPIMHVLVNASYYESWQYAPFLVLAVAFSCLVTFLGTIYNVAKHNRMVTVTASIGAVVNVVLNLILIRKFTDVNPFYGAQGAAIATFASYLVVFIIRAVDTQRYMKIRIRPMRILLNSLLLLVQIWAALSEPTYWIGVEIAVLLLLVLSNLAPILFLLKNIRRQLA